MPPYTDPFFIVGTGMQLILLFWVLYLFVRLHKYFKGARKASFEPEVAAWAKVVMDPHSPRRPQKALVQKVARGLADAEGNKRANPWVQRGIKVGIIVLIVFLLFNLGFFAPFFNERAPTVLTFTARVVGSQYFNGTSACGNATVTQTGLVLLDGGGFIQVNFEGRVTSLNSSSWYEFAIQQSPRCRPGYYEIISLKEVGVSARVAPPEE